MIDNRERNKQNCNVKARPSRIRSCDEEVLFCFDRKYGIQISFGVPLIPCLKTGKQVVE